MSVSVFTRNWSRVTLACVAERVAPGTIGMGRHEKTKYEKQKKGVKY
jgi:hypothetical protein